MFTCSFQDAVHSLYLSPVHLGWSYGRGRSIAGVASILSTPTRPAFFPVVSQTAFSSVSSSPAFWQQGYTPQKDGVVCKKMESKTSASLSFQTDTLLSTHSTPASVASTNCLTRKLMHMFFVLFGDSVTVRGCGSSVILGHFTVCVGFLRCVCFLAVNCDQQSVE